MVPALDAAISSFFHPDFAAQKAIDGDPSTLCASNQQVNAWLSVRLPSSTPIAYVSILNRGDSEEYAAWLSSFEVWVGSSFGDTSAVKCGELNVPAMAGPFVVNCAGAQGKFVTLRQVGAARFLTIAELEVYATS